jgi:hypothetical protein
MLQAGNPDILLTIIHRTKELRPFDFHTVIRAAYQAPSRNGMLSRCNYYLFPTAGFPQLLRHPATLVQYSVLPGDVDQAKNPGAPAELRAKRRRGRAMAAEGDHHALKAYGDQVGAGMGKHPRDFP